MHYLNVDPESDSLEDISWEAFNIGHDYGYDVAQENLSELPNDPSKTEAEEFITDMAQHESEVFRQYSPFELLASDINKLDSMFGEGASDEVWSMYNEGVLQGIRIVVQDVTGLQFA